LAATRYWEVAILDRGPGYIAKLLPESSLISGDDRQMGYRLARLYASWGLQTVDHLINLMAVTVPTVSWQPDAFTFCRMIRIHHQLYERARQEITVSEVERIVCKLYIDFLNDQTPHILDHAKPTETKSIYRIFRNGAGPC
jgi:hypothetical protein